MLFLESIFLVNIISSDMCLLFEALCAVFNDKEIVTAIEVDETTWAKKVNIVTGTMESGVEKRVGEQQDEVRARNFY